MRPENRVRLRALALLTLLVCIPTDARAQSERRIVKVEEDWVALIKNPEGATTAPQIVNVISPGGEFAGLTGLIELNHSSSPEFTAGGFQVQAWNGDVLKSAVRGEEWRSLYQGMDRLEYTITMEKSEDGICFGIEDGKSRSWGRFAHHGVTASLSADDLSLNGYSPEDSVTSTNVNVGAHRVDILYLREVRRTFDDGSVERDDTMRVIHRFQQLVEIVSLDDYDRNSDYYNIEIDE